MCVFSKKEKETQKTNSPTGIIPTSVHPTSVYHHYLQQYQAWFYVPIFLLIYSKLIKQLFGEFTCNVKKSILEFSIQRRRIWLKKKYKWKKTIMLLGLHLCKGKRFIVNVFVLEQCILSFFDFVIVVVVILLFIVYVVFQFY